MLIIKKDKIYTTRKFTLAYEFAKPDPESVSIPWTLKAGNGVFFIGKDELSYYFQTILPYVIDGRSTDVWIEVKESELEETLSEDALLR